MSISAGSDAESGAPTGEPDPSRGDEGAGAPAPHLFNALVNASPDGVVICDARTHVVQYVNRAFEHLTGYPAIELLGRNMRLLHGEDRDQEGLTRIRVALKEGQPCQAILRSYRRDGTLFWNELRLVPLRAADGQLTQFASFHRETSERLRTDGGRADGARAEARDPALSTQTILAYMREDKLTGLMRRAYFDELLKRDFSIAQRESRALSLFLFELDFFDAYRDLFGRTGADQTLRRVARTVGACFRRAADLVTRYGDLSFAAVSSGMDAQQAVTHAQLVMNRVRDLAIHHPRSSVSRYLTLSAGVVTWTPATDAQLEDFMKAVTTALQRAREAGHNQAATG